VNHILLVYLGSPEAEPLASHHVPEDVHNRSVEPDESHFANVPGIIEAEPLAGHHVPEDVHNRNVENI
jgi:hypothetical protein